MSDVGVTVLVGVTAEYAGYLQQGMRTIPQAVGVVVVHPAHEKLPDMPRECTDVPTTVKFSRGNYLNVAAQHAEDPIVVLADADFLFLPGYFELLSYYLDQRSLEDHYVNSYVYMLAEKEDLQDYHDLSKLPPYVLGAGKIMPAQNPCMVSREHFVENLGGYDPGFHGWGGEDDDLDRRMQRLGLHRVRLPLLVLHQYHGKISAQPEYYDSVRHGNNVAIINRNDNDGKIKV